LDESPKDLDVHTANSWIKGHPGTDRLKITIIDYVNMPGSPVSQTKKVAARQEIPTILDQQVGLHNGSEPIQRKLTCTCV
jgi:hypothetical protein